ncbi:uncharacterized protein [Dermacentor albipictus]|uniref:uncharacterized protein isoform X3 n=1 Tax=Dermacentor albipictus TaxID=60249 RepID=UPI0038FCD5A8
MNPAGTDGQGTDGEQGAALEPSTHATEGSGSDAQQAGPSTTQQKPEGVAVETTLTEDLSLNSAAIAKMDGVMQSNGFEMSVNQGEMSVRFADRIRTRDALRNSQPISANTTNVTLENTNIQADTVTINVTVNTPPETATPTSTLVATFGPQVAEQAGRFMTWLVNLMRCSRNPEVQQ